MLLVGEQTLPVVIRNLSLGGALVHVSEKIGYGLQVRLRVKFPTRKDESELDATVRWFASAGVGLQFGSLHAIDVHAINAVINQAG